MKSMKRKRVLAAVISTSIALTALPAGLMASASETDPTDPPVGADAAKLPVIGTQTTGSD